jgi:hypothetical protein
MLFETGFCLRGVIRKIFLTGWRKNAARSHLILTVARCGPWARTEVGIEASETRLGELAAAK